jgi:hypothetical protein
VETIIRADALRWSLHRMQQAAAARPDTSTALMLMRLSKQSCWLAVNSTFYFSRKRFGARRRG